ncbi:MAG TPA: glutamine amidotransferase family protein [Firmicutes bacterium]|uniref:Glutamine amidotransferase family protein n=1 Tax=Capillibacterium thermochitinicola TaxID=2699427 RepID=A0A8J6HVT7_9FIRM|nr:glutamine amidotransferase family protein [Capillibacterium thermochitinicola]MBA2132117.1 glutamine amidotransferase family protein [Capillibacterium thermochitinicola]HHW12119.1 glutamine amidotransferase family protein [Bacillota bacterium]
METRRDDDQQCYEGQIRIPSGCAVAGFINKAGERVNGRTIAEMMAVMHERSNGLGAGYAAYGIYPEYRKAYAFHVILADDRTREEVTTLLARSFKINEQHEIPVRRTGRYKKAPLLWRYFCTPVRPDRENAIEELILTTTMRINRLAPRASVMSCGQDLGVFKGVGYPEEIAEFYRIDQYRGYSWIGHGRFPTNTPGWWGGAHPFSLGEIAVVHNGELSSYGTNKSVLENFGYELSLRTDTEVLAYAIHHLRRQNLSWPLVAKVLAPPHWTELERMGESQRELYTALRRVYGGLLMNGPFSIIVAFPGGLLALNDRLKLRSLVAGTSGADLYLASEEAAVRQVCPQVEAVWSLPAGEALICQAEEESACHVA